MAEVVLGEGKQVAPGGQAWARLRLAEAAPLVPGDRFILRQASPVITVGGGIVLDAAPLRKTKKEIVEAFLGVLNTGDPESILLARLGRRGAAGLTLVEGVAETGWRKNFIEATLAQALAAGKVARISERYVLVETVEKLEAVVIAAVAAFQRSHPLVQGVGKELLREESGALAEVFSYLLERAVLAGKLAVSGEVVHLPGQGVVLKDEEAASKQVIEAAFAAAGFKVPALGEVLAGLKIDQARAKKLVTLLLRDKILVKVTDDLVFHRNALDALRALVRSRKTEAPTMDVAAFKDMTGVSRKYAIPLLEYMDRERITRRVGNERVIL